MVPLPGNPSWERNLRTRSRRTRQHSIVFVHFCTYVDGTCSFDQPKRNLENVKVRLCTAIFSISFALHTHTRWMNIMNHQHTGQRMDKKWTKNGQSTIHCCLKISALQLLQCCGLKAWVTKLLLFTVQTRFISIQWSLGNWAGPWNRQLGSFINIIGKNSRNSGSIYVLSQVLSNIVQTRHPQLGVM